MATKKKAKKTTAKKSTAKKKTAAKKPVAKKSTAKTPAAKTPAAKKTTAKRSAAALKADRLRVSLGSEAAYMAKKHGVDVSVVTNAIKKVGNMRVNVEAAIKSFKVRSKAADQALVSSEVHEIGYLANKFKVSPDRVLAVVREHGPGRKKVEAALSKMG
jgi:pyruvate/2-oxoglutarate dehydrogenase complex dihydrolipoamide acyltransferase (E2) component